MIPLIALLASPFFQAGQEPAPPPPEETVWNLELIPEGNLYRPYLADPRQSRTGTKVSLPVKPAQGHVKIENCLGSTRPLALWKDPRNPDEAADLSIEVAVFSRFDIQEGWDMDAADYRFGFPFAYRRGDVTMKMHLWHTTSHLGDEYMTRVPERYRDSYHNDELSWGLSWQATPMLRFYGELGYGIYTGPDTDKGRAQLGMEYVGGGPAEKTHPYLAVDLSTRKEIDWDWNLCAQLGIILRSKPDVSGFRFLAEYYRGHDQQTQFKSDREHYLALGVATDF
jgi:hypothetical protein